LSPLVLERYAQYMHQHRTMPDGSLRGADNWQKGIPKPVYMDSALRHVMDWWKIHRKLPVKDGIEDVLCAVIFNAMGYLYEILKRKKETP